MGGTNPDRAYPPPSPFVAVTLGRMAALGWEMVAVCGRCGLELRVNVRALVTLHGANTIWWGRHPRCRKVHCNGRVTFSARSVRHGSWTSLGRRPGQREIEAGLRLEAERPPDRPVGSINWRGGGET